MISFLHSMPSHIIILLGLVRSLGADLHHAPLETMADVTNDFGVCVLQIIASPNTNTVFSPYGLMSMALLVYEGATGQTAAEIYNTLHLPWHRDIVRIGFRDLHRYLRSYFSTEGFLKGLVLSKPNVPLRPTYIEVLKFYGFQPDTAITEPVLTTQASVGNREKETNDTLVTDAPETTTYMTTITTGTEALTMTMAEEKGTLMPHKEKATTLPMTTTSLETTTSISTSTKKTSTKPGVLSMKGSSDKTTIPTTIFAQTTATPSKPGETTMLTTIVSETTKRDVATTELQKTTLKMVNEPTSRTTELESRTEVIKTTISNEVVPTSENIMTSTEKNQQGTILSNSSEENESELATTEMNVITLIDETPPALESMNMVIHMMNKTVSNEVGPTSENIMTSTEKNQQETILSMSSEENKSELATTEMNVITLIDETPPALESMNMVIHMMNKTDTTSDSMPGTTVSPPTDYVNNEETTYSATAMPEFIAVMSNEITTKEVFSGETTPGDFTLSTILVDTTLPLGEVFFLTTPSDIEVMTENGTPMLGAFILMDENKNPMTFPEFTTDNVAAKRSTENLDVVTEPLPADYVIPLDSLLSNSIKGNETQLNIQTTPENESESVDNQLVSELNQESSAISPNSVESSFENILLTTKYTENNTEQFPESSTETNDTEEESSGFPTLEPDTIIFPTSRGPRLRRSVKPDKKPAQLGNWVGAASGWHPSPTEQWFWTYSGDKLVPVLTYTAHLPYAELPSLRATAVQLPLDDARYTLMILLPKNSRGLKQMLHALQWHPLRNLLKLFKPTPVYAVVPTFTIVKHINLTPALHKLGIRNIFDAYQANLCELSEEPNLYVRSIEQVITISIQKYYTDHNWIEASPNQVDQNFLATHPFAYFVVDVETKVSLVAGTMVDPSIRNS